MVATLLEGKKVARKVEHEVSIEVEDLKHMGKTPHLKVILVGDNPASQIYVANKEKACRRVGIESATIRLPGSTTQSQLLSLIDDLNRDSATDGILVQLPLPPQISVEAILSRIDPRKDVDGFTPENMGRLTLGYPFTVPCTPAGILELLSYYAIDPEGMNVVIVGRSNIVGKPLAVLLMQKARGRNCTVTVCHSATRDISLYTRSADMVVVASGKPGFLQADMVREGSIIIDVGVNRVTDQSHPKGYRIVGDANFEELKSVVSYITPVPGGVGPLTVAMLLRNTVKVARHGISAK